MLSSIFSICNRSVSLLPAVISLTTLYVIHPLQVAWEKCVRWKFTSLLFFKLDSILWLDSFMLIIILITKMLWFLYNLFMASINRFNLAFTHWLRIRKFNFCSSDPIYLLVIVFVIILVSQATTCWIFVQILLTLNWSWVTRYTFWTLVIIFISI